MKTPPVLVVHHGLMLPALAAWLLLLGSPVSTSAATMIFREGLNGYSGTADTYINNNPTSAADTNYGSSNILATRYSSNSSGSSGFDIARESRNVLILFSNLGNLSDITSASLTLTVQSITANSGGSATIQFLAYEMLSPWTESGATWNLASSGTSWATPGAKSSADRDLTPVFTSPSYTINSATPTLVAGDTITITLDPLLVQSWVDDPSANYGILLSVAVANKDRYPAISFYSSEETDASLRPALTLQAVPEPSTLSFVICAMGAVGFVFIARRRNHPRTTR